MSKDTVWKLYNNTDEIWKQMFSDVESAQFSVDIEQYCFFDDEVGHKFLKLFEKKHSQGLKVRLLCDAIGSIPLFTSSYVKKLRKAGVIELVRFNPLRLLQVSTWLYRNHKKTMIVDGQIGWIGGVGLKVKFKGFRDSNLRLEGPVVLDMQHAFDQLWNIAGSRKFMKILRRIDPSSRDGEFELLVNGPAIHQKEILNRILETVANAKHKIYVTTPYFIPSKQLLALLTSKAKHGVDVRILCRGKNDDSLSGNAAEFYFHEALEAGVKIYQYMFRILHTKTIMVDDGWATVGSTNINNLSLEFSYEANVCTSNLEFVKAVETDFLNDLEKSRQVLLADWKNRSYIKRLLENLTRPMHNYI